MSRMSSYLYQNPKTQSDLRKLIQICKSSHGPSAHFKIISNEDELEVTTQSLKILKEFQTNDPLLQLIISVVNNYVTKNKDGGFKLTLYITNWLQLSLNCVKFRDIFDWIGSRSLIIINRIKIQLNRDNIKDCVNFTENLIKSKPASNLNNLNVKHLALLLVRALINSLPNEATENGYTLGRVDFLSIPGADPSESKIIDNAIIHVNDFIFDERIFDNFISSKPKSKLEQKHFKICVVSGALDESLIEKQELEYSLDNLRESYDPLVKELVEILESENVEVLACQKGLHSTIRLNLERRGVLVLERLGAESSETLKRVSYAQINHKFENWPIYLGELKSIEKLEISNKKYLSIKGKEKTTPFQTILIRNLSEEITQETKTIIQKSYEILKGMFLREDNNLIPGAGCSEAILINHLKKEVKSSYKTIANSLKCTEHSVIHGVDSFCDGLLLSVAPLGISPSDLMTDKKYGHLFCRDFDKCQCGMIKIDDNLGLHQLKSSLQYWEDLNELEINSNKDVIIFDNYKQFYSALSIAIETTSLLLRTALCLYETE